MKSFVIYVNIETYGERWNDRIEVAASSENSARIEAERQIVSRYGRQLVCMQVTEIVRA